MPIWGTGSTELYKCWQMQFKGMGVPFWTTAETRMCPDDGGLPAPDMLRVHLWNGVFSS